MGGKGAIFGNRIVETRQMWVDGNKAQRAAQFPDGVMERMIDFNPEEQTIISLLLRSETSPMPVDWK